MKLRNLLLTAALFLTGSIAFASGTYFKVQDVEHGEHTDHYWKVGRTEDNLAATVIRYDNSDDWAYVAYTEDTDWTLNVSLSKNSATGLMEAWGDYLVDYNISYDDEKNMTKGVYYFALPYSNENKSATLAVKAYERISDTEDSSYSIVDSNNHNNSTAGLFTHVKSTSSTPSIYLSYSSGGIKKADIAFGQPLPTPVVTLLIALGFGAAFVMYRNRKQVKA